VDIPIYLFPLLLNSHEIATNSAKYLPIGLGPTYLANRTKQEY